MGIPANTTQVITGVYEVLVRDFDGSSWDAAAHRFQGVYDVRVTVNGGPLNLPLGTSPLVLQTVPEPSTLTLALVGLGATNWFLGKKRVKQQHARLLSPSPSETESV
jgi:hypothetical protein